MSEQPTGPAFTGLLIYRNLAYRYSFLYPDGWQATELAAHAGQSVLVTPMAGDSTIGFSVEARDLGATVSGGDLAALRRGFLAGLRKLPGASIERHEDYVVGQLLGLEAWQTYGLGGARHKRWVRLLYQGSAQIRLVAQASSSDQFDYWLPAFTQMMRSFRFGDWWAEATGQEWLPSLLAFADEPSPDEEERPTPPDPRAAPDY